MEFKIVVIFIKTKYDQSLKVQVPYNVNLFMTSRMQYNLVLTAVKSLYDLYCMRFKKLYFKSFNLEYMLNRISRYLYK